MAGPAPQRHSLGGCSFVAGLGLGLFFFVALFALLGQALRVNRRAGRLLALAGQLEAVLFSQVQQGRDTHPAPGFDTSLNP